MSESKNIMNSKSVKKTKDIGFIIFLVLFFVLVGVVLIRSKINYVVKNDPYEAIKMKLEEIVGKELKMIEELDVGNSHLSFKAKGVYAAKYVSADNKYEEYVGYAYLNDDGKGYSYSSDYYNVVYRGILKDRLEQAGKAYFGEDVDVWVWEKYYSKVNPLNEDDYTYDDYINDNEFDIEIIYNEVSDLDAREFGKNFYEIVNQELKIDEFEVDYMSKYFQDDTYEEDYMRNRYAPRNKYEDYWGYDVISHKAGYENARWETDGMLSNNFRLMYQTFKIEKKLEGLVIVSKDGKKGVVNISGKRLGDWYDEITVDYNDEIIWLQNKSVVNGEMVDEGFVYIPTKAVCVDKYASVSVKEEYILVSKHQNDDESLRKLYGVLDLSCQEIVPCEYLRITMGADGIITAERRNHENDYYDLSGNKILGPHKYN